MTDTFKMQVVDEILRWGGLALMVFVLAYLGFRDEKKYWNEAKKRSRFKDIFPKFWD